ATCWRCVILGDDDRMLHYLDGTVISFLVAVIALLSTPRPISLARLKVLELVMIGVLAGRVAMVEYRIVMIFSLRNNPTVAQLTVKNIALLTSVLILTYGLYVPKSRRRAALVVGPLALLPYATLAFLYLRHPGAMGWLGRGWKITGAPRF